ncbi:DUF6379 domain-containing protein [Novosphingobium sp. FKTRR1]|uniref:C-glycoside deglycosidase beta subunit domain-containing protein n=1 Tax=Novosphingobium sp. FKTRR1 TaxID=2879118 RepID=UPI001CF09C64|nr:DUF6379 domain-containing protein [Novosphingobium sp. FKTRR1]
MLPVERVIGDGGLSAGPDGGRLDVRLPWYRSLPLSTVRVEALEVDGAQIPLESLRFELDGGSWTLAELEDQTDRFWFVLDSARLVIPGLSLAPGSAHRVALTISLFPPYIPGMKRANAQSETLLVR